MPATTEAAGKETATARMARWAAGLSYQQLSQEAVYQAKRFLFDSVGCALGGYQQHDVKIALEVLDEIAGRGPATVIGSGKRIDPVSASLANALMIRSANRMAASTNCSFSYSTCTWKVPRGSTRQFHWVSPLSTS